MAVGTKAPETVDVFIVDADPGQRRALAGLVSGRTLGRFQPRICATPAEASAARRNSIVIADIESVGGIANFPDILRGTSRLIATSATSSLNVAVQAVRAGAIDFLPKPIGAKALLERLEAALATPSTRVESSDQPKRAASHGDFAGFIGDSPAMRRVYEQVRRMAPSRAPVFISGESGTGKEVCAEAIHQSGNEPDRPFIAINCSAIPKELMESEIFGHVRGAFTGASENRTGAAELADGGTLFLDEIAEMDLGLQAKLLRFVQTGTLRRVGGTELKKVDVRIVAATNRDAEVEVAEGRFRADLFYRLHVLPIHLPPLRERRGDIMPLAEAFLMRYAGEEGRHFAGFDAAAAAELTTAAWPGNVRQLQNAIRRLVVLHDGDRVTADMLPALGGASAPAQAAPSRDLPAAEDAPILPFWQEERRVIESAVTRFGGNIARAAAALDISPSTIYRKRLSWAERRSS